MEVCHTDTYDNCDIQNAYEYKGHFFNDNDKDEPKFYEHGAHFPNSALYQRLEQLLSNKSKICYKKMTNVFNIKSRNINHKNKGNITHNINKERFIISTKHINNKSSIGISSLTINKKKSQYKNLFSNQIRPIEIKAIKEKAKMNKEKGKTKLSCSYQNLNKGIASHSITSIKYQKSRNISKNNTSISKHNDMKTIIKEKKRVQSTFKEKPRSVERINKRSVIRASITSSIKENISTLKKIPNTLSSSVNKKKQSALKSKTITHQVTTSSTSPPKTNISSRNRHTFSVIKNSIIRSIKNKSIIADTKKMLSSSNISKRSKIK